MVDPPPNPYVGPRAFERDEAPFFFGREGESRELVSLVVAERVVLLYAASGAGKSSLLRAGLVPLLEGEERFEAPPIARIRSGIPEASLDDARNVYMFGALLGWGVEPDAAERCSLSEFLAGLPRRKERDGLDAPRVVIFDQFEELLTLYPAHWHQRADFFEQVADALEADPLLRIVFALREDYVGQLDPYAATLPGGLRARLRLARLGREQALEAVDGPARRAGRIFAVDAARKLVSELLTLRIDTGDALAEVEGEFVEPVQLQVVCQNLWSELPEEVDEITEAHVREFGDVDDVLRRFFDNAVSGASSAGHVHERRLRQWIEDKLITSVGTRNTIYRGREATDGVPNPALDELENRHVIRAEWRAGTRWYELTHDRLIAPIQASNARFRETLRRQWRRIASAAVAGVSLAAIAPVLIFASGASHTAAQRANLSVATRLNLTLAAYENLVSVASHSTTPNQGRELGNLLTLAIATEGLRGQPLLLRAETSDVINGGAARGVEPTVSGIQPRTNSDTASVNLWIPLPRATGRFRYRVSLSERRGVSLAVTRSQPFTIRSPGSSASPTVPLVQLSVTKRGDGTGTVVSFPSGISCGAVCSAPFPFGARVELRAFPAPGSLLLGWVGQCRRLQPACDIRVGPVTRIAAEFRADLSPYVTTPCGSIDDRSEGLEWYVGPDVDTTWDAAARWARRLRACGGGWELPAEKQLRALFTPGSTAGVGYAKNGTHFPARIDPVFGRIGHGSWVWTSQSVDPTTALAVNLHENAVVQFEKRQTQFPVRAFAVRPAQR